MKLIYFKLLHWGFSRRIIVYSRMHKKLSFVVLLFTPFIFSMAVSTLISPKVQVSFVSESSCVARKVFLPNLHKVSASESFNLKTHEQINIGNMPILSKSICVSPRKVPLENSVESARLSFLGLPVIGQTFHAKTGYYPKVQAQHTESSKISVKEPLTLSIDQNDTHFSYIINANEKSDKCEVVQYQVICPVQKLGLKQGNEYKFSIVRMWDDEIVGEALVITAQTITSVDVTKSSIKSNATIYDNPKIITLEFNKPLTSYGNVELTQINGENQKVVDTTVKSDNQNLIISINSVLPRSTTFKLEIDGVTAFDKGLLEKPYVLDFQTSSGPKIVGVNIGDRAVLGSQTIVLSFDQTLKPDQSLKNLLSFSAGGASYTTAVNGKQIIINPSGMMPACKTISIKLADNLQNQHGVSGGSSWQYNSRVRCASITTIGYSKHGRAILAYQFGSGSSRIVYVGGTHGNEKSSKYLMDSWIYELEGNPGKVPAHRSIVVIPNLNPDGFASSSRLNSNSVDLNRNFPASDWQSGTYIPGGIHLPKGGGTSALSEPESSAIYGYITGYKPRLVLTFHAVASAVIANGSGDSSNLAAIYASHSGYRNVPGEAEDGLFAYPTTGEMEDWLHDVPGITALLVELATQSGYEFSRNRTALWAIAQLP